MILDELFQTSVSGGYLKATSKIPDIPITTKEFTPAYWLGWMDVSNIPQVYNVGRVYATDDDIIFETLTNTYINKDIYMECSTDISDNNTVIDGYANNYYDGTENVEKWVSNGTHNRLVNNLHYQQFSRSTITIRFAISAVYNTNIYQWTGVDRQVTLSIQEWLDFISGETTLTVNFNFYGNVELSIDMFDEDGFVHLSDEIENQVLYISNYSFSRLKHPQYPQFGAIVMGSRSSYINESTVDQTIVADYSRNTLDHFSVSGNSIVNYEKYCNCVPSADVTGETAYCNNGAHGIFSRDNLPTGSSSASSFAKINGNVILSYDLGLHGYYIVNIAYHPIGIAKHAGMYRWEITESQYASEGYGDGTIFYPLVNLSTNEFTGNLITGDESYVKPRIPMWMKYDVDVNTYTEDDKPEPGEDDDTKDIGDSIENRSQYYSGAYNFITQYAMNRFQLGKFGEMLWTSWADSLGNITDMWKNFKVFISGGDTGSVDIGSVLEFIVSLKVFPFAIDSFIGVPTHNVCIGRGKYPLVIPQKSESDTGVWRLTSTNYIVNCGTIKVPRPFNDFRDYTNMNITAYLPYCGTVELNPGDVIGMQLNCKYSIDLQSGACVAIIEMYNSEDNKRYNVAMLSGQIGATIPITATNSGQIAAKNASAVFGAVSTIASTERSVVNRNIDGITGFFSGKMINDKGKIKNTSYLGESAFADYTAGMEGVESLTGQALARLSQGAISAPSLSGGGNLAAFNQPKCPYIQMRYGKYSYPKNYKHSVGYPSTESNTLVNYHGFCVCTNVDIDSITCHSDEKAAIKELLETGVYL